MAVRVDLDRAAILARLHRGVVDGLNTVQLRLQQEIGKQLKMKASHRSGKGGPSSPGSPPARATGTLARSWTPRGEGYFEDKSGLASRTIPRIKMGSNLVYARIHEYGGVITAKGKSLAIPLNAAAKSASAMGLTSRQAPKGAKYAFVKSVRLPRRPYVGPATNIVRKEAKGIMERAINRNLRARA